MHRRLLLAAAGALSCAAIAAPAPPAVLILVYHRFADSVVDGMTVRESTFAAHLSVLQALGCRVVRLADLVAWHQGASVTLPPRAVVLCADDGHRSQFERMAPLLARRDWPVTLFVYPSAVSNASYAMSWQQLQDWQSGGRCDIESHSYWHPNFMRERQQRTPADFERFARGQLLQARERLEQQLGRPVRRLAWPFGLVDKALMALAAQTGHDAAFTLGHHAARRSDPAFALPRWLMTDALASNGLEQLLLQALDTA